MVRMNAHPTLAHLGLVDPRRLESGTNSEVSRRGASSNSLSVNISGWRIKSILRAESETSSRIVRDVESRETGLSETTNSKSMSLNGTPLKNDPKP